MDSNHHGEISPQGPQPRPDASDASAGVHSKRFACVRVAVGHIWRGVCSHDVLTARHAARARSVVKALRGLALAHARAYEQLKADAQFTEVGVIEDEASVAQAGVAGLTTGPGARGTRLVARRGLTPWLEFALALGRARGPLPCPVWPPRLCSTQRRTTGCRRPPSVLSAMSLLGARRPSVEFAALLLTA
jgi:hypothetical protein